jgi:hypothetical protein
MIVIQRKGYINFDGIYTFLIICAVVFIAIGIIIGKLI